MKKRILTWVIICCMVLQGTESVAFAAETSAGLQGGTVSGNDGTDEPGEGDTEDDGTKEPEEDSVEDGGTKAPEEDSAEDGGIKEPEEGGAEDSGMTNSEGNSTEDGGTETLEADDMKDAETEASEEAIGEAISLNLASEAEQKVQYAQSQAESFSVAENRAAGSAVKASKGLYFGYVVQDSAMRTGVLAEYLSESGNIVLPHKLGNYYMTGIGKNVFANMNQKDTSDTSKLPSQSTSGKTLLSSGEEKILESVNAARMKEGKIPLIMSSTLRETARRKSLDMLNKNYFDHKNTDGTYTSDWLTKCGYPWYMWAENIAYNYESAERLYDQWWNSTGHRNNMMHSSLRAIGIGVYKDSNGRIMGTQVFSSTVFQNLTSVRIEYGYETIGAGAFSGCTNLKSITIPSTVTEIAEDAFKGCDVLTIYGKAGSYAQTFAEKNSIPFESVEETCPIQKFCYEQEEIFMEKGDMDSVSLTIEPAEYRHLIKEGEPVVEQPVETQPEGAGTETETGSESEPEKPEVIAILEDGTIRALEDGTVTLTARAAEKEATCRITVGEKNVAIQNIRFYEDSIELYEKEVFTPTYCVSPADATQGVQLLSSNSEVLAVEADGTVKALKAGTATLTVKAVDSDVQTVLEVQVLAGKEDLVLPEGLKALTNIDKTLANVLLDAYPGFSWKEPQTKLQAKKGETIQYFAAQYTDDTDGKTIRQDCIIPVAVSAASGQRVMLEEKTLPATKKLSLSETYTLYPGLNATGAEVDASFYDVNAEANKEEILKAETTFSENAGWTIQIIPRSAGKCVVTVEIKLKDRSGGYGPAKKTYGTYQKKYTFQIEEALYANGFKIMPAQEMAEGVQCAEDGSFLVEEGVSKFRVRAYALDKNGAETDTALTFGTDKSGVVQVRAVKGETGLAEVTVKKTGEAVLSVTAKDNGKRSGSVRICVQRTSPQLQNKTWTLNKWKPTLTVPVLLEEAENNLIQKVELYEDKDCQKLSSLFAINGVKKDGETDSCEADAYMAGFLGQNTEQVKKGSYKVYLQVTTERIPQTYVYPITIKLKNTKPSVTLKQSAQINLFYKNADAQLAISSGTEKISQIRQVNEITGAPHFRADFSQEGDVWAGTISPVGVTADNYKKIKKTVELQFSFQDYGEGYVLTKKLTVKSNYQKITLTTSPTDALLYLATGNDRAMFRIMDKKSKDILIPRGSGSEGENAEGDITVTPDSSMTSKAQFHIEPGSPDISVRLLGTKSLTAKMKVAHDNWREPVSCSFKMTVNKKTPTLTLEKTKVSLNTNAAGREVFSLKASANKNETVSIVRLKEADIVGANNAAKKLLEEEKLSICPQRQGDSRMLTIRLNDSSVRKGTYKYKVYGWCMVGETKILRMNPVTLSITVSNKQPSVSLKAKGKIKASDLAGGEILYTPKIANVMGEIRNASLSGAYASAFTLTPGDNGAYRIKAKDGAILNKGSYKLYMTFRLENGVSVTSKAFTVKIQ
ncbi:MAG: leucine-rich repeat protein [Muribaculaceae bacterium]|nr:leucine-rich repeat protein [Muribaculaceae bacterium]